MNHRYIAPVFHVRIDQISSAGVVFAQESKRLARKDNAEAKGDISRILFNNPDLQIRSCALECNRGIKPSWTRPNNDHTHEIFLNSLRLEIGPACIGITGCCRLVL